MKYKREKLCIADDIQDIRIFLQAFSSPFITIFPSQGPSSRKLCT
jgi:hypothetical protein